MKQDQFAKDINFQKVVFLHVNRILDSKNNIEFMRMIKLYEVVMTPYIDDDYIKGVESATENMSNVSKLDSAADSKNMLIEGAKLELAETKFAELMCLAERNGLLLEKTGYGYGEDEEEEDEEI